MRRQVDLRSEAYVFWSAVSDFRRELRLGKPVSYPVFVTEIDTIHEISEWPQIRMRCISTLVEMNGKLHRGMLA